MAGRSSRKRSVYTCQGCGQSAARWLGRCPGCGEWNSMVEELQPATSRGKASVKSAAAAAESTVLLGEVEGPGIEGRLVSGSGEIDRVLGGGLVPASAVLLGGDPGIGKSTLALQLASALSAKGACVLYVAGEEAPAQVRLRADRLARAGSDKLLVLAETDAAAVIEVMRKKRPAVAVIDSIQTLYSSEVESAPGSVSQLRETCAQLVAAARELECAVIFIGHVTREGTIAGPRVLEHMVDTVLYFEGGSNHAFRILRAVKNRFGAANEIGVFEMAADGLREVPNPSLLLSGGAREGLSGSSISSCMEGSRPVLVEIQALVSPGTAGSVRRTTLGVDHNRVAMLAAVMEKRLGLSMASHDIFVNTAGGVRLDDPGVDLAVMASLASSLLDVTLPAATVVLGEVGLTGEVRAVSRLHARVKEAARLGFKRAVVPAANSDRLDDLEGLDGLELLRCKGVADAWRLLSG